MGQEPHNIEEAVGSLEELAQRQDRVAISDMLDQFGERSFGPVLMMLALLEISPIGGIPGLPTFLAVLCALIAGQLLLGHDHLWMPQWVQRRSLESGKLLSALCKVEGVARKLDKRFRGRLERFTTPFWQKLAAAAIILLCLTVPPLELVPFASTAPMLAIASFGLALTVKDGLLMLIATVLSALALGASIYFVVTQVAGGGG